jgi:hypothetical protein
MVLGEVPDRLDMRLGRVTGAKADVHLFFRRQLCLSETRSRMCLDDGEYKEAVSEEGSMKTKSK